MAGIPTSWGHVFVTAMKAAYSLVVMVFVVIALLRVVSAIPTYRQDTGEVCWLVDVAVPLIEHQEHDLWACVRTSRTGTLDISYVK